MRRNELFQKFNKIFYKRKMLTGLYAWVLIMLFLSFPVLVCWKTNQRFI